MNNKLNFRDVEVGLQDERGDSVLHLAVRKPSLDIVNALIDTKIR